MAGVIVPLVLALVVVPLANLVVLAWIVQRFTNAEKRRDRTFTVALDKRDLAWRETLEGVRTTLAKLLARFEEQEREQEHDDA